MSILKRMKKAKENKKGFTLVELIVVLVILAILAAATVPALTGWIDKAKEKTVVVNARTVYIAAQTVASEEYAKDEADRDFSDPAAIRSYLGTDSTGFFDVKIVTSTCKVDSVTYTEDGVTVQWTAATNEWTQLDDTNAVAADASAGI